MLAIATVSSSHGFNPAERSRWSIFCCAIIIIASLGLAMIAEACSARRDQLQQVGNLEDYVEESQTEGYPYSYVPYDPFLPGYGPDWYAAPIYYFSLDGDGNDCKKVKCSGGKGGRGAHTGMQAISAGPIGGFANGPEFKGAVRFGGDRFGGSRMDIRTR